MDRMLINCSVQIVTYDINDAALRFFKVVHEFFRIRIMYKKCKFS